MSYSQLCIGVLVGLSGCSSAATPARPSAAAAMNEPQPSDEDPAPALEQTRPRAEHGQTCASGSVTVEAAHVCIRLPPGYEMAAPLPGVQRFEAPGSPPITLRWQPSTSVFAQTFSDALVRLAELDAGAILDSTRDGAGTFVYAVETQPLAHRVAHAASTLQIGDTLLWCSASAAARGKLPRAFFEACQSLMGNQSRTPGG